MTKAPQLTDRKALIRNRARTQSGAMFLHQTAADEIHDRLQMVNKSFKSTAVVTGHPEFWARQLPSATVLDDTETLEFDVTNHDLILHSMGLHWANDPVGQIIQCRRALQADGMVLVCAFGGQTLNELRACLAQAEAEVSGGISPRVAPMAELRDMGALLQRAGFALPVADSVPVHTSYSDMWHLMKDLRAMGEGNALHDRLRRPTARGVLNKAASLYQTHFSGDDGRITATFELIFLTGWAPHESQPKPLRPGSAQQRLADALGTPETKLPN